MCYFNWVLLTSNSLFWRKQTSSIWFGDREMQTFREKTYTRNNSFMNYQQIYSFNQWNDWEEDTFLSTLPENDLKICYRLQNIAILATERTQLPHPKNIFPRSSPFYRMWRHFSLDDPNTKNVPGVVECSPPPLEGTTKKCTKDYNAREQPLYGSSDLLLAKKCKICICQVLSPLFILLSRLKKSFKATLDKML